MKVIKRNGDLVDYDLEKISIAISGAFEELGSVFEDAKMLDEINSKIESTKSKQISVEDIQDIVEEALCKNEYVNEARAYIRYRYKRELVRKSNTTDQSIKELLDGNNEYWNKENSNKNAKWVTTQRDYIAGITSKDIARRFIFPEDVVKAHDEGVIHIHDMDYAAQNTLTNCCLINLADMLQNGTVVNGITIDRPHKLLTAMTIATQIIAAVASSQYGGTTITLTHLAPFVRDSYNRYFEKYQEWGMDKEKSIEYAEKDVKKEITDAIQTLNYQLNSLTTTNG